MAVFIERKTWPVCVLVRVEEDVRAIVFVVTTFFVSGMQLSPNWRCRTLVRSDTVPMREYWVVRIWTDRMMSLSVPSCVYGGGRMGFVVEFAFWNER